MNPPLLEGDILLLQRLFASCHYALLPPNDGHNHNYAQTGLQNGGQSISQSILQP